jgi:hypothetical protein
MLQRFSKQVFIVLSCICTGGAWHKSNITYAVLRYPSNKRLQRSAVDEVIEKALTTWANVAKLNFLLVPSDKSADITVAFVSSDHGDGEPFDGEGMVLAHAYSPPSGRVHFDDDEPWTIRKYRGKVVLYCTYVDYSTFLGCDIALLDMWFSRFEGPRSV